LVSEFCFREIVIHEEIYWACEMDGDFIIVYSIVFGRCERKRSLENSGLHERVILKWILR
jgi:hypothetical protein